MPEQARGLSEYLSGTLSCKICDNEYSHSSLRDTEVAGVDHPVADVQCAELGQRLNGSVEVFAFVGAEGTPDVFPDGDLGVLVLRGISHLLDYSDGFKEQAGSGALDTRTLACY